MTPKMKPVAQAVRTSLLVGAASLALGATGYAACGARNPCSSKNPCSAWSKNPCAANPCAAKKVANPCAGKNPCGAKRVSSPCGPCAAKNPCAANPCAAKLSDAMLRKQVVRPNGTRLYSKGSSKALAKLGEKLWNDSSLGTNGLSCSTCHTNFGSFNATFGEPFPHTVAMADTSGISKIDLDEMVQLCLVVPMKGKPLGWNSQDLGALTAYTAEVQKGFRKVAMNPCAAKNPCAANPCLAKNPCGSVNPCAAKNPCAANPCAAKKVANPCGAKNPCSAY